MRVRYFKDDKTREMAHSPYVLFSPKLAPSYAGRCQTGSIHPIADKSRSRQLVNRACIPLPATGRHPDVVLVVGDVEESSKRGVGPKIIRRAAPYYNYTAIKFF